MNVNWKHPIFEEIQPHIVSNFKRWIYENPNIYSLFKKFAYEARNSKRKKFGAKFIVERIRWNIEIETRGEPWKISNNHTACLARLLISEDPSFEIFFRRCITNV